MVTGHIPTVLTIAGSDPSGGAGIQADLKTFTALGVYGAAVITALTAQNTQAVTAAMPVPEDFVRQQLDAVLTDIRVDVIKLGMIPNAQICEAMAPFLKGRTVVCDPVMVSTSGFRLIDDAAVKALTDQIIPISTYLTPNFHELEILCSNKVTDIIAAGMMLMEKCSNLHGIVLKGGHTNTKADTVTDIFIYKKGDAITQKVETHPRYHTKNTHGTGCTFSSAFAAFLAQKYNPPQAFSNAISYVNRLIALSKDASVGHGNGPLLHHKFPSTGSG
ncbi:MAG: bifunctional hydroxymethylpyrimidine kinase/phosphomethylpyrimidine kinase [Desulfobacterales bacterium]|jgi:hydroxymethylpyrimidine kinase/phosphomethylpyrimidine kinase|nr:bifunctional hydroxymethylpyrimidine kinase/phosphomethylpyrimidine kinase [Desulfobacterales bacterium]